MKHFLISFLFNMLSWGGKTFHGCVKLGKGVGKKPQPSKGMVKLSKINSILPPSVTPTQKQQSGMNI